MKRLLMICMLLALTIPGYAPPARAQDPATEAKIQSAMSAAPSAVAGDATIMDYSAEGGAPFVELRQGSNGWTCFPDWPVSPGNDPACYDQMWVQWNDAFNAGTDPNITSPGVAYMLQGGSDASNTDPFAAEPAPGEDWVNSGPHVMLLFPGKLDTTLFSTDPNAGGPYVMWAGTPYEHIMMPVEVGEMFRTEDRIQSAISAAPMAIASDATILDFSAEGGAPFVELRQGSSGWTCLPDWPVSPGNDPVCNDQVWMQWQDAFMAGTEPNITAPGLAYMLQGGSDASNTDPFAMEPAPGEDWVNSPAHVMLLFPGKLDTSLFSTDHTWGGPYVMWAGTPYEHIMMPVQYEPATVTAAGAPAALPSTGAATGYWLVAALALAGLGLLGGGWLVRWGRR
jgi:hypothetical protein